MRNLLHHGVVLLLGLACSCVGGKDFGDVLGVLKLDRAHQELSALNLRLQETGHEIGPSIQFDVEPAIPNIFVRVWYFPTNDIFGTVYGTGGTMKIGVSSNFGGVNTSNTVSRGTFYCMNGCERSTACWQADYGERFQYVLTATQTRCFAIPQLQTVDFGENGIRVRSYYVDRVSTNIRFVSVAIQCDESVWGNENFTLKGENATEQFLSLVGSHRCACPQFMSSSYCRQLGAQPTSEISEFTRKLVQSTKDCRADRGSTFDNTIWAAIGIIGAVTITDIVIGLYKRTFQKSIARTSWFYILFMRGLNLFAAPDTCMLPSEDWSGAYLLVLGTTTVSYQVGGVMVGSLFVDVPTGYSSFTEYYSELAVQLLVYIYPLTVVRQCSIRELGSLLGFGYSIYGVLTSLLPTVCSLDSSVGTTAFLSLPTTLAFSACAGVFGRDLLKYFRRVRRSMSKSVLNIGKASGSMATHLWDNLIIQPPGITYHRLPDTRNYLKALFANKQRAVSERAWVSGGEARLWTAQALSAGLLICFLTYWCIYASYWGFFLESFLSNSRCCGGISCFADAGLSDIGEVAEKWQEPNTFLTGLSGLFGGTEFSPADATISFGGGTCAQYYTARLATECTFVFCGIIPAAGCFWHFYKAWKRFRKTVVSIQSGKPDTDEFSYRECSELEQKIAVLKFTGTQAAFALASWLLQAICLVLLALLITMVAVLPTLGVIPGLGWEGIVEATIWYDDEPQWLLVLTVNYVSLYIFVWMIGDHNRAVFAFSTIFEQFFYTLNGFGTLTYRIISAIVLGIMYLTRVDLQLVPGEPWFDPGYDLYYRMIQQERFSSNKVMLAFCTFLLEGVEIDKEETLLSSSTSHVDNEETVGLLSAFQTKNRRALLKKFRHLSSTQKAVTRWQLLCTLVKNPNLCAFRKHKLCKNVLKQKPRLNNALKKNQSPEIEDQHSSPLSNEGFVMELSGTEAPITETSGNAELVGNFQVIESNKDIENGYDSLLGNDRYESECSTISDWNACDNAQEINKSLSKEERNLTTPESHVETQAADSLASDSEA